jgi:hypothetical protein
LSARNLGEQVLATLHQRAARLPPDRQQLGLLIRTGVVPRPLECPRQKRVGKRLARNPLRVKLIGLAALARPVLAAGAVRAHIAHVMAAVGQKDRGVPAPGRGALDPPPHDRAELPRPHFKRTVAVAGNAEVL